MAFRNAADIGSGREFRDHVTRLIRGIEQLAKEKLQLQVEAEQQRERNRAERLQELAQREKEERERKRLEEIDQQVIRAKQLQELARQGIEAKRHREKEEAIRRQQEEEEEQKREDEEEQLRIETERREDQVRQLSQFVWDILERTGGVISKDDVVEINKANRQYRVPKDKATLVINNVKALWANIQDKATDALTRCKSGSLIIAIGLLLLTVLQATRALIVDKSQYLLAWIPICCQLALSTMLFCGQLWPLPFINFVLFCYVLVALLVTIFGPSLASILALCLAIPLKYFLTKTCKDYRKAQSRWQPHLTARRAAYFDAHTFEAAAGLIDSVVNEEEDDEDSEEDNNRSATSVEYHIECAAISVEWMVAVAFTAITSAALYAFLFGFVKVLAYNFFTFHIVQFCALTTCTIYIIGLRPAFWYAYAAATIFGTGTALYFIASAEWASYVTDILTYAWLGAAIATSVRVAPWRGLVSALAVGTIIVVTYLWMMNSVQSRETMPWMLCAATWCNVICLFSGSNGTIIRWLRVGSALRGALSVFFLTLISISAVAVLDALFVPPSAREVRSA